MVISSAEIKLTQQEESDIQCQYSFPLSKFQLDAIHGIRNENHVLVTAHTGSGKTLPAEYAIRHFVDMGKRVIYTAPVKALSNQKFNEFSAQYPDISFGILTGDTKFNPQAQVLIMTTEILRNQLIYRKSKEGHHYSHFEMDLDNDLACVIFDEVHYINDLERGRIWEETIIEMPKATVMVMLSATIDKPHVFAEWVESRPDDKNVVLIETSHRVVPLTHTAYVALHESHCDQVKDKTLKKFIDDTANRRVCLETNGKTDGFAIDRLNKMKKYILDAKLRVKRAFVIGSLVEKLEQEGLLPGIAFIFSRKQVEQAAYELKTRLTDGKENFEHRVEQECNHIMKRLSDHKRYTELPEYDALVDLLKRGIAIHHAGMIPVFRELVEMLFAKGLIKFLFATETFAVGINMPTKTVIFTSLEKFDGHGMRLLHPHEYTQMAGRAGRRGLDTEGHVIHCLNLYGDRLDQSYIDNIIHGRAQTLQSKFTLSYNLVLNMLSGGSIKPDSDYRIPITDRTMLRSDVEKELNQVDYEIADLQKQLSSFCCCEGCGTSTDVLEEYHALLTRRDGSNKTRKKNMRDAQNMRDQHHRLEQDYGRFVAKKGILSRLEALQTDKKNINEYFELQTKGYVELLERHDFIVRKNNEYCLTETGIVASKIQEGPGHIMAKVLIDTNLLCDLDEFETCAALSGFCGIRVKEESGAQLPQHLAAIFRSAIKFEEAFKDQELRINLNSISHQEAICSDIALLVLAWAKAASPEECRIARMQASEMGLFLGEFIKCVLKVITMIEELVRIADNLGYIELMNKLVKARISLMKDVATSNSLYL